MTAADGISAWKRNVMWNAPARFSSILKFSSHSMHFLSNKLQGAAWKEMNWCLTASMWSLKWDGWFYNMAMHMLQAVYCGATGVVFKKFLVKYFLAGLNVFVSRILCRKVWWGFLWLSGWHFSITFWMTKIQISEIIWRKSMEKISFIWRNKCLWNGLTSSLKCWWR